MWSTSVCGNIELILAFDEFGQTKISYFDVPLGDKYIGRFDVPM